MQPIPQVGDVIASSIVGFWAFLGAMMRGVTDWRDPATGKVSYARIVTAFATALVLGQIASALGTYWHWEGYIISGFASVLGYIGPAATMQLFQQKFLGAKNVVVTTTSGKD